MCKKDVPGIVQTNEWPSALSFAAKFFGCVAFDGFNMCARRLFSLFQIFALSLSIPIKDAATVANGFRCNRRAQKS